MNNIECMTNPFRVPIIYGIGSGYVKYNNAIKKVKAANDTTAQVLIQSACGMTVGAYNRLESPTDRRGVDLLCGGNGEDPITLQGLQRFLEGQ
jgi:hypothetical protein